MDGGTVKVEPEQFTVLESSPIAVDGASSNMVEGSMMNSSANKYVFDIFTKKACFCSLMFCVSLFYVYTTCFFKTLLFYFHFLFLF